MSRCHRITLLLILFIIRSASSCNPVSEFENRDVTTTNTSHLIGYQLPSCPPLFHLTSIIDAELSNPASSQPNALNITDLLRNRCLGQSATPCSVDIPLIGLYVPGDHTVLTAKVNYTCRPDDQGWPEQTQLSNEKEVSETSFVKYIRVKLVSFGRLDWNCTISSSGGSAVTGSWRSKNCVVSAFGCLSWNRTAVASTIEKNNLLSCLEPQTIGRILFVNAKFCSASSESIVIDVQVPLDSDFDIACNVQSPANTDINSNDRIDLMKSECSQLTWTPRPQPSTSKDLPTSTPSGASTLQGARDTEIPAGVKGTNQGMDQPTIYMTPSAKREISSSLGLGLGIGLGMGLGLGLLLVIILIAVFCIRRKNRSFGANTINLATTRTEVGGAMEDKDGGFVLANDIFTVHNIYETLDVRHNDNHGHQDGPREEKTEIGYDQKSKAPPATSPPPVGKQPKRASSLSRKLFKQIAKIAKQEEQLESHGPVEGEARGRPDGGTTGDSETSLVDRWLYSSALNSAENTLNQKNKDGDEIYINRRFEMDV